MEGGMPAESGSEKFKRSRISEIVGLFESPPKQPPKALQSQRSLVPPSPTVDVKKIISKLDPCGGAAAAPSPSVTAKKFIGKPDLSGSAAISPSVNVKKIISKLDPCGGAAATPSLGASLRRSVTSVTPRRWVQIEKEIDGKVVARVWLRRRSSTKLTSSDLEDERKEGQSSESLPERRRSVGRNSVGAENATEGANDDEAHCSEHRIQDQENTYLPEPDAKCLEEKPGKNQKAPPSTNSRASHFISFRIDDADTTLRLKTFQDALCNQYPFLESGRTSAQKFHLSKGRRRNRSFIDVALLVLSLKSDEVTTAIEAMNRGVNNFRQKVDQSLAIEFRTVGVFNTRLLFVAPPLRQRLLLNALHIELAKACGRAGLTIIGAGAGWTSTAPLQSQLESVGTVPKLKEVETGDQDGLTCPSPKAKKRPVYAGLSEQPTSYADSNCSDNDSCSACQSVSLEEMQRLAGALTASPSESMKSCRQSTYLDLVLLKKYDISGYRSALFVPQVSLFKAGRANRRSRKGALNPENTVQRILTGRLWSPASESNVREMITTSNAPQPPFGRQSLNQIDLVEMSLSDPDGYYKRLHSMNLVDE